MQHNKRAIVGVAALGMAVSAGLAAPTAVAQPDGDGRDGHKDSKVDVHIARNHQITMPRHIRAGRNTFDISCERDALLQLIAPDRGYSRSDLAHDANRAFGEGKRAVRALEHLEANVTFKGGALCLPKKGALLWVDLDPDKYFAVDVSPEKIRARNVFTFFARGDRRHDGPDDRHRNGDHQGDWRKGAVIRAIHEHDWARRPRSIEDQGTLTFVNDATENHILVLAKLNKGKTVRDFAKWVEQLKKGHETRPPADLEHPFETGVLSPDHKMTTTYDLPSGDYILLCFWPDAEEGGTPHFVEGMFRGIEVG